ncbi:acyl carrier protein [Virgibacillus pantothenticus]|uniref:acyl carrier protein n=1 Tax=Virgibacillus pantothenticus TaxID=1473 RepID=UPI002014E1CE|nr:acyl carrier protein [Virgibacillus pantothenticus]
MNEKRDIFEEVVHVLTESLSIEKEQITLQSNFKKDLGADSLDLVELVIDLEEFFNIEISDEEAENFLEVGDVLNYLAKKLKNNFLKVISSR